MNILVTGATKGIGRAIIERFADAGFNIAFTARTQADLHDMEQSLQSEFPNAEILAIQADMSKKADVLAMAEQIKDRWDSLQVLVNNAGVFFPGEVISEADGALEQMIDTNLYSAYYTTRALLPLMLPQKKGHIFNMCSVASLQAYPNGGSYSISKFALLGFSKALREELKQHKIRVTSIAPGATLTASWAGVDLPESRFMDVKDVAEIVFDTYKLSQRTVVEDIVLRPMEGDI